MDRPSPNPLRGMLSALRAARLHREDRSPDAGLVGFLQNVDFLPAELREDQTATTDEGAYDDLPPLEDDAGPSTSRATRATVVHQTSHSPDEESSDSSDDLPALESSSASSSPSLSSHVLPSFATTSLSTSGAVNAEAGTSASGSSLPSNARSRSSSATRPPHATMALEEDDEGAESDSSMPSLFTVSASSDSEDSYDESDAEWDSSGVDDSIDDSEDDHYDADVPFAPLPPPTPGPGGFADLEALPPAPVFDSSPSALGFGSLNVIMSALLENVRRSSSTIADMLDLGDITRAQVLLDGLETIPHGLVRRYERLHTTEGEDKDGCAICRDDLLDMTTPDEAAEEAAQTVAMYAALPFQPAANNVVAFPCAGKHLYHSDCLIPWLSCKTTCPSCRFDLDPHSLTHKRNREAPNPGLDRWGRMSRNWQPPQTETMNEWLDAEERAQACGVPRTRPQPVMQTPGPAPLAPAAVNAGPGWPGNTHQGPLTLEDLLDTSPSEWHPDHGPGRLGLRGVLDLMRGATTQGNASDEAWPSTAPPVALDNEESFFAEPEVILQPEVSAQLAEARANGIHQVAISHPPGDHQPGMIDVLEFFNTQMQAIVQQQVGGDAAPNAAAATPTTFEDFAHGLQLNVAHPIMPAPPFVLPMPPPLGGNHHMDMDALPVAFDAAAPPPPVQADPSYPPHAVAPAEAAEGEFMNAMASAGVPETDVPPHDGPPSWADELD
ncbi:hypothetical protein C2E23DRAFT_224465 [Lenzites betulinus]|nr:hypothetical protein C2E23DRAFT_224465 [Lenzites betulinus]